MTGRSGWGRSRRRLARDRPGRKISRRRSHDRLARSDRRRGMPARRSLARVFILERETRPTADTSKGIPRGRAPALPRCSHRKPVWQREWDAPYMIDYSCGPRATPTVHDGLVYGLGAEGHLVCVRAEDGSTVWQRDLKHDFQCTAPTWGFAGHPLVYKELLLCLVGGRAAPPSPSTAGPGRKNGARFRADRPGIAHPRSSQPRQPEMIHWHGEAINALDPATGKVHWTMPRDTLFGVSMAMPRQVGDELLDLCILVGQPDDPPQGRSVVAGDAWETERESDRRTTHLNALMCTPLAHAGHLYGVCSYGQLRCLEWTGHANGKRSPPPPAPAKRARATPSSPASPAQLKTATDSSYSMKKANSSSPDSPRKNTRKSAAPRSSNPIARTSRNDASCGPTRPTPTAAPS